MKAKIGTVYKILILSGVFLLPFMARGAAYWMEITGSKKLNETVTVRVIYGNIDESGTRHRHKGKELQLAGDFSFFVIHPDGVKEKLQLIQKEDCWEAVFTPAQLGLFRLLGINSTHPVVDRSATGGENVLPIDYLCGEYQIGSGTKMAETPALLLDITAIKKDQDVLFKVFRNGKLEAAGTKMRIFNPENWEKELSINKQGEAGFSASLKGMYNIRLDWIDPKSGNYLGVNYTSIRHRCNYCLFIE